MKILLIIALNQLIIITKQAPAFPNVPQATMAIQPISAKNVQKNVLNAQIFAQIVQNAPKATF